VFGYIESVCVYVIFLLLIQIHHASELTDATAAAIVDGLAVGCQAVTALSLGQNAGWGTPAPALVQRYVGVLSCLIVCRPTCSAAMFCC